MSITYRDSDHSYTANGERYISATTLIGKLKFPTDWKEVATKYAEKNGETAEYWQALWAKSGDDACGIGSTFHKLKEDAEVGYTTEVVDTKAPVVQDYFNELPDGVHTELLLWNHEYRVAGQADKVVIESKGLIRYADIIDYKTNKKIDMVSYKDWKTGHKMMQGPAKGLMCCNFSHYTLQLSLYAWMLEEQGFTIRKMHIEHYPERTPEGEVDYNQIGIHYKVNYLRKEIVSILNNYKKTIKKSN